MIPDLHNARLVLVTIFLGSIVAVLAFDFWAWLAHGRQATASALVTDWSKEWKVIAVLCGLMMGHLFSDKERSSVFLIGLALGILYWS